MGLFSSIGSIFGVDDGSVDAAAESNRLTQAASDAAQRQARARDVYGAGGSATFADDGTGTFVFSDDNQRVYDQQMGTLQEFGGDPYAAGRQLNSYLDPYVQQRQDERRINNESRLLAQGRLGGTGGQNQAGRLEDAFGLENAQRDYQGISQAQQMMQRAFGNTQAMERGQLELGQFGQRQGQIAGNTAQGLMGSRVGGIKSQQGAIAAAGTPWANALKGLDGIAEAGLNYYTGGMSGAVGGLFDTGGLFNSTPNANSKYGAWGGDNAEDFGELF